MMSIFCLKTDVIIYIFWLVKAKNIIIACYIVYAFVLKIAIISSKRYTLFLIIENLERKISHADHHAPYIILYVIHKCTMIILWCMYMNVNAFEINSSVKGSNTAMT